MSSISRKDTALLIWSTVQLSSTGFLPSALIHTVPTELYLGLAEKMRSISCKLALACTAGPPLNTMQHAISCSLTREVCSAVMRPGQQAVLRLDCLSGELEDACAISPFSMLNIRTQSGAPRLPSCLCVQYRRSTEESLTPPGVKLA